MPFEDLLVHLDSYPEGTSPAGIDDAVAFAAAAGGKLSALAMQVAIPLESNRIADYLIGLSSLVEELEARSLETAQAGLDRFTERAKAAGVFGETLLARGDLYRIPELVAARARTRDACLLPLGGRFDAQHDVVQGVIFGSGRPAVIFKPGETSFADGLRKVSVAWDGGRCAARAVAEAMPILQRAAEVRVLVVVGEKPSVGAGLGGDLLRHLGVHGITATLDEVAADGRKIGDALDAYLDEQAPDLLVMGAYGHSRTREFILGGATEHMLRAPPVPVLLAH